MTTLATVAPVQHAPNSLDQRDALDALVLARSQHMGTTAAENGLMTAYLPAARSLANRYRGRGVDLDDLRQLAFLGLVKAAKGWDPEIGAEFLSFAYPLILGEIKRFFRDHSSAVRMPRRLQELHAETATLQEDFVHRAGRNATDAELAAVGVDIDQIRAAAAAIPGSMVTPQLPSGVGPDAHQPVRQCGQ